MLGEMITRGWNLTANKFSAKFDILRGAFSVGRGIWQGASDIFDGDILGATLNVGDGLLNGVPAILNGAFQTVANVVDQAGMTFQFLSDVTQGIGSLFNSSNE